VSQKSFDNLATILNSFKEILSKIMEMQERKLELAKDFAKKLDETSTAFKTTDTGIVREKTTELTRIPFEQIIEAIFSSPSGDDESFMTTAGTHLLQQDEELVPDLTKATLADMRLAFMIRFAQDCKQWDASLRKSINALTIMSMNVAASFKHDRGVPPVVGGGQVSVADDGGGARGGNLSDRLMP